MKYLTVDAALSGTGIKDTYDGVFINPIDLGLSAATSQRINQWLLKYENAHYGSYENDELISQLDAEGKEIALAIKNELVDVKIIYFSDTRLTSEMIF